MNYTEAKRRWNELKLAAARRELSTEELIELRECFRIVEAAKKEVSNDY